VKPSTADDQEICLLRELHQRLDRLAGVGDESRRGLVDGAEDAVEGGVLLPRLHPGLRRRPRDPNPRIDGDTPVRLRDHGVEVELGDLVEVVTQP
jgi:hypothetical protein